MTLAHQPTQAQMYYQAERSASERDLLFLDLVKDGLTQQELRQNIARRPHLWSRYRGWLPQLPAA